MHGSLDNSWIEAGLDKFRSKFSNVILFESGDPLRLQQFIKYISGHKEFKNHQKYTLAPWSGLKRLSGAGNIPEPVRRGDGDRFTTERSEAMSLSGAIIDMRDALRHMDRLLVESRAILVLHDADRTEGCANSQDVEMPMAVRCWANSPRLMMQNSLVVCFCNRSEALLDTITLAKVAAIKVDLGSAAERNVVIDGALKALGCSLDCAGRDQDVISMQNLIRLTAGLNLHQLNSIVMESWYKDNKICLDRVSELKSEWIKREDVVEIFEPSGGFERVGGYETQKTFVQENLVKVLQDVSQQIRWGTRLPKGVLLFGPPGTGKSLFARALAGETNLPFINLKTENLFKKYLGESGQTFARAIAIIEKNAPAIVFVDEIDRFGSRRDSGGNDGASMESRRVFNQLLEWLGGDRDSILVGTTNRPQDLDPALLRPGRLDYKIAMLFPDRNARFQILSIHMGLNGVYHEIPADSREMLAEIARYLADSTENFSGAELEELVNRIRRIGSNSGAPVIKRDHVDQALHTYRINAEQRMREIREYIEIAKEFSDHAKMMG